MAHQPGLGSAPERRHARRPGAGARLTGRLWAGPAVPLGPERLWAGLPVTFGFLVVMLVAITVRQGHQAYPGPTLLTFTFVAWAPLLVRTRWPVATLVAVVVAESLHLILVPLVAPDLPTTVWAAAYQPVPLATMAATWTLASRRPWRLAWGAGIGAAVVLLAVSLVAQPITLFGEDMVMFDLVVIATAAGAAVTSRRRRGERLERRRQAETAQHVTAERLRIARDLHDVLAHHLTLVNAQAGVANYLLGTDPQRAQTALRDISAHTRSALDELRATVGLLRQDGTSEGLASAGGAAEGLAPVPGLERLPDLLAGLRTTGAVISLAVTGTPVRLMPNADLAAYRIIQEALTNATKHAPGAPVDVTMDWGPDRLELRIENGPGRRSGPGPGTGHGLIGMRERAHSCGGDLVAERSPTGGFLIRATLPAPAGPVPAGPVPAGPVPAGPVPPAPTG